jgi:hypothetical protein
MQRAAMQLDLAVNFSQIQAFPFGQQITSAYVWFHDEVKTALKQGKPFTLIHLETLLKIVVPPLQERVFDQEMLSRTNSVMLVEGTRSFSILAPEDVILLLLVLQW